MPARWRMPWGCSSCCVRADGRSGTSVATAMTSIGEQPAPERVYSAEGRDLRLFIVAGEHSGDALGAKLMAALNERRRGRIRYVGVGGELMAQQGLVSQFPLQDVAVMGIGAILARLADHPAPRLRHGGRGRRRRARCARHHRQPRVHAPDRASACAGACPRSRSSTTCRRACGPGARGGRARCATTSTTCWRCCRSSPMRTTASGGPPCTYVGHPLDRAHGLDLGARHRPAGRAPGAAGGQCAVAGAAGQPDLGGQPPDAAVRRGADAADGARAASSRSSFPSSSRCAA